MTCHAAHGRRRRRCGSLQGGRSTGSGTRLRAPRARAPLRGLARRRAGGARGRARGAERAARPQGAGLGPGGHGGSDRRGRPAHDRARPGRQRARRERRGRARGGHGVRKKRHPPARHPAKPRRRRSRTPPARPGTARWCGQQPEACCRVSPRSAAHSPGCSRCRRTKVRVGGREFGVLQELLLQQLPHGAGPGDVPEAERAALEQLPEHAEQSRPGRRRAAAGPGRRSAARPRRPRRAVPRAAPGRTQVRAAAYPPRRRRRPRAACRARRAPHAARRAALRTQPDPRRRSRRAEASS